MQGLTFPHLLCVILQKSDTTNYNVPVMFALYKTQTTDRKGGGKC